MAAKPAVTKTAKVKRGDIEKKGKSKSKSKVTSIGNSRNSKPNNKRAVRERKGR